MSGLLRRDNNVDVSRQAASAAVSGEMPTLSGQYDMASTPIDFSRLFRQNVGEPVTFDKAGLQGLFSAPTETVALSVDPNAVIAAVPPKLLVPQVVSRPADFSADNPEAGMHLDA